MRSNAESPIPWGIAKIARGAKCHDRALLDPICVGVNDAAGMSGVGRTKRDKLIAAGEIETVKPGNPPVGRIHTGSLTAASGSVPATFKANLLDRHV